MVKIVLPIIVLPGTLRTAHGVCLLLLRTAHGVCLLLPDRSRILKSVNNLRDALMLLFRAADDENIAVHRNNGAVVLSISRVTFENGAAHLDKSHCRAAVKQ